MTRKRTLSRKKKAAALVGAAGLVGGIAVVTTGISHASVVCDGLDTALRNNQTFIADQKAHPDAQSAARIANREAVIKQIGVQREASGCGAAAGVQPAASASAAPTVAAPGTSAAASVAPSASVAPAGAVVCAGSTVTLSGEAGAPAASSNQFPQGTKLKVTNLDNNKSTVVTVTSTSGSCALLNNAAFELVREPGKFLIRHARIERVG
jgi:membrane protease subunit (stomatin/prohibitin family)